MAGDRCSWWRTSLVRASDSPGVPLKSFAQVKGQIVSPPSSGTAARKTSLLFPRAQSQAVSPVAPVRCVHRLGGQVGPRRCRDPGGPDSQHLSLGLPPRRRLRQPAPRLPAPARPHNADAPGAPFHNGALATLLSLLLSSRDPLPVGRPQPPRHVPASTLWVPGAPWFILAAGVQLGSQELDRGHSLW